MNLQVVPWEGCLAIGEKESIAPEKNAVTIGGEELCRLIGFPGKFGVKIVPWRQIGIGISGRLKELSGLWKISGQEGQVGKDKVVFRALLHIFIAPSIRASKVGMPGFSAVLCSRTPADGHVVENRHSLPAGLPQGAYLSNGIPSYSFLQKG